MYYGAHNGAFRIYPAHRAFEYGAYDPTKRPWYIAASSVSRQGFLITN